MRALLFGCAFLLASCGKPREEVVVYASADEEYASLIFAAFEKETSIHVAPLYDTEEAKTLGLVHRILAEKDHPQADVFWSGECARTAFLKKQGVLEPYRPESAHDIPARWRDPANCWTGFGMRCRVIAYNTRLVKDPPQRLVELMNSRWKGRIAMANPLFGTTATHLLMLSQLRGEEWTLHLLRELRRNEIRVVGGNSHVRDLIANGTCDVGLTDSDDVLMGKKRGDSIAFARTENDFGNAWLIPNSAALMKGAPHPKNAKRFLDWLLRKETEEMLLQGPSQQIPIRKLPVDLEAPLVDWDRLVDGEAFLVKAKDALGL